MFVLEISLLYIAYFDWNNKRQIPYTIDTYHEMYVGTKSLQVLFYPALKERKGTQNSNE